MKTIHEKLVYAFDYSKGDFDVWKRALRNFDVTCNVINALDDIPQGTKYHPEFDALKHVWYVCRGVMELDRVDLLETAFLHDYGKGKKTNIGSDRIYHFGHPKESVRFIDKIKDQLKYYELTRRLSDKHMDLPIGHKKLSGDEDLDDFVTADKIIGKSIFEREVGKFIKILNKIKEKFVLLKQKCSRKTVYIMIGISGSGKSRYLKSVDSKYIVSPDEIRRELVGDISDQSMNNEVWAITKVRMKVVLRRYGKVYLDATNVNKWLRIEFMSDYNDARKIAVVFDVDVETAVKRVQKDIDNEVDRAVVPESVIRKMYKLFKKGENSLEHEFNKVIYL